VLQKVAQFFYMEHVLEIRDARCRAWLEPCA